MMTTKRASLFIAVAVLVALTAGCSKEELATEEIDLTQVPDLFEQPLQPNPLAPTAADVVVTVDGIDITHGEIMQAVQVTMAKLSRQMPPQQLSQMYGQVYQNMAETLIASLLLEKAAQNSSLAVSDSELDEEIATIKADAPEGQSLEDALAANEVAFDVWREDLRSQMLVGKLVEEKTASVPDATLAEVATFYQENIDSFKVPEIVTASHILLTTKDLSDEEKAEKKTQLEKIKADIAAGTITFADAAKKYSEDPGSAANGGEYKDIPKGRMVPEFEDAAFSLDLGTVSDVVETQFGYHLIKTTDHQPEGVRPLSEVTEQLTGYLTGQKKQEALLAYIETLRENANIIQQKQDLDAGAAK